MRSTASDMRVDQTERQSVRAFHPSSSRSSTGRFVNLVNPHQALYVLDRAMADVSRAGFGGALAVSQPIAHTEVGNHRALGDWPDVRPNPSRVQLHERRPND